MKGSVYTQKLINNLYYSCSQNELNVIIYCSWWYSKNNLFINKKSCRDWILNVYFKRVKIYHEYDRLSNFVWVVWIMYVPQINYLNFRWYKTLHDINPNYWYRTVFKNSMCLLLVFYAFNLIRPKVTETTVY